MGLIHQSEIDEDKLIVADYEKSNFEILRDVVRQTTFHSYLKVVQTLGRHLGLDEAIIQRALVGIYPANRPPVVGSDRPCSRERQQSTKAVSYPSTPASGSASLLRVVSGSDCSPDGTSGGWRRMTQRLSKPARQAIAQAIQGRIFESCYIMVVS